MTQWDSTLSRFRDQQRSRILDAVERLLNHQPDRELTIQAVAAEAGVTRPTVYKYFPDLHHIVAETAARWLSDTEVEVARRLDAESSPLGRLRTLLATTLERLDGARIAGTAVAANISAETAPMVLHEIEKMRLHVERILADGLVDGSFRSDLDPESDSRILMVMLDGLRGHVAEGHLDAAAMGRAIELITSSVEGRPAS
jgi:AcrR family transcriptional regulator